MSGGRPSSRHSVGAKEGNEASFTQLVSKLQNKLDASRGSSCCSRSSSINEGSRNGGVYEEFLKHKVHDLEEEVQHKASLLGQRELLHRQQEALAESLQRDSALKAALIEKLQLELAETADAAAAGAPPPFPALRTSLHAGSPISTNRPCTAGGSYSRQQVCRSQAGSSPRQTAHSGAQAWQLHPQQEQHSHCELYSRAPTATQQQARAGTALNASQAVGTAQQQPAAMARPSSCSSSYNAGWLRGAGETARADAAEAAAAANITSSGGRTSTRHQQDAGVGGQQCADFGHLCGHSSPMAQHTQLVHSPDASRPATACGGAAPQQQGCSSSGEGHQATTAAAAAAAATGNGTNRRFDCGDADSPAVEDEEVLRLLQQLPRPSTAAERHVHVQLAQALAEEHRTALRHVDSIERAAVAGSIGCSGGAAGRGGSSSGGCCGSQLSCRAAMVDSGCVDHEQQGVLMVGEACGTAAGVDVEHSMLRTGGGYLPVKSSKNPEPKCPQFMSGFALAQPPRPQTSIPARLVPRAAVSIMADFHSQHCPGTEWQHHEALLLLLGREFRREEATRAAQANAKKAEEAKVASRRAAEQRSLPEVLEGQRVAFVQAQLAAARRALGKRDRAQHRHVMAVAERGYQIGHALDAATANNKTLKHALSTAANRQRQSARRVCDAFARGAAWHGAQTDAWLEQLASAVDQEGKRLAAQGLGLAGRFGVAAAAEMEASGKECVSAIQQAVAHARHQVTLITNSVVAGPAQAEAQCSAAGLQAKTSQTHKGNPSHEGPTSSNQQQACSDDHSMGSECSSLLAVGQYH